MHRLLALPPALRFNLATNPGRVLLSNGLGRKKVDGLAVGHQSIIAQLGVSSRCLSTALTETSLEATSSSSIQAAIAGSTLPEPTFESLGLAHAYPSGWLQAIMEVVHVNGSLPWWATIAVTTLSLRLLTFPIVIATQRNMIRMNNLTPELQRLQIASIKAKTTEERTEAHVKMSRFMSDNGLNPLKSYLPLLCQGVIFTSMFFGIRGMADCPVESMRSGGMGWFLDLTVADPIYLLPFLTSFSLFVNLRRGADGVRTESLPSAFRYFMLAMPFISFPIMCSFPAALNVYWFTTNVISLVQATIISLPAVRSRLGVGECKVWKSEDLPMNQLMSQGMKDSFGLRKGQSSDR